MWQRVLGRRLNVGERKYRIFLTEHQVIKLLNLVVRKLSGCRKRKGNKNGRYTVTEIQQASKAVSDWKGVMSNLKDATPID